MKPIVENIEIPKERIEELEKELKKMPEPTTHRYHLIRKIAGSICCLCGEAPTKKVIYRRYGTHVVERFCDKCFSNKVKLLDRGGNNEIIAEKVDKKYQKGA